MPITERLPEATMFPPIFWLPEIIELPTNKSVTVKAEPDAVVKFVCPATVNVPSEIRDVVAVITPPVVVPTVSVVTLAFTALRLLTEALTALRNSVKRFVELALTIFTF